MPSQMEITSDIPAREVVDVPVATEMSDSFLAYGLSVITARAIPDVRDGLKPVQRRILWSMLQMGLRPGTRYRKSARIVGDTMGRYHPHGDAAIYDALVRLGQDFGRMVPLVDPQGNFGSLDDPPAAARYTECRLAEAAMDMVDGLDEDTVDLRPTYDGEGVEPVVLPAALPNLLVNGTAGIAVGMATNMAPHNLAEIARAIELVMDNQDRGAATTAEQLLGAVPGPDFPGGGLVIDQGRRQVVESGRGRILVQALTRVVQVTRRRKAIVVTELPHQVGPERVVAWVTKLAGAGRLAGVAGIADLSDMEGLRIQIDLKPDADPRAVLAELHRLTPLEDSFFVNNVVLVDGVPTTVGLRRLCEHYIEHRLVVVERRTRHRLEKAARRLEIVEGLITALDNIDEVVALIRASASSAEARDALMARFELTEVQAVHILDMPLRRLTALENQKLAGEAEALRSAIGDYEEILASERRRRAAVRDELRRIVADHGRPRRSKIVPEPAAEPAPVVAEIAAASAGAAVGAGGPPGGSPGQGRDVACVVTVSTSGHLGRVAEAGPRRAPYGRHDLIAARAVTSTEARLGLVTSAGRAFTVRAGEAADANNRHRGAAVAPMLGLGKTERVLALVASGGGPGPALPSASGEDSASAAPGKDSLPSAASGGASAASGDSLVMVTAAGMVKRLTVEAVLGSAYGEPVISLRQGDRVAAAFSVPEGADMVMVAADAQALRTASAAFPASTRNPAGALGMKLRPGVSVAGAGLAAPGAAVVLATGAGRLKCTDVAELPARRRGGFGLLVAKLEDGEQAVAVAVTSDASLLALKARDGHPRKVDPRPVPVRVEVTKRYAAPTPSGRRIHVLAPGRW